MTLNEIIGQPLAVKTLQQAVSQGRLAHAYLFYGDAGVGKRTTAEALARQVLCAKQTACGQCPDCRMLGNRSHPGLRMYMDGNLKIDDIRAIQAEVALASIGPKFFIIDSAETMNLYAANAFLKILEDPPPNTSFCLLAENMEQVLPTIRSRCQIIRFGSIPDQDILGTLMKLPKTREYEREALEAAVRMARGSLGRALRLLNESALDRRQEINSLLAQLPTISTPHLLGISLNWSEEREQVMVDLQLILQWMRDLLFIKHGNTNQLYNPDFQQELTRLSQKYSARAVHETIEILLELVPKIRHNARPRFVIGYLLLMIKKGAA